MELFQSVTELRSGCSPLESNIREASVGRKERLLYSGDWQTGEKADSCPKAKSPPANQGARAFKGEFQGWLEWVTCRTAQSALTIILKLVMQWSDQCHLDCFKYS